jgi:hypothetical protein
MSQIEMPTKKKWAEVEAEPEVFLDVAIAMMITTPILEPEARADMIQNTELQQSQKQALQQQLLLELLNTSETNPENAVESDPSQEFELVLK